MKIFTILLTLVVCLLVCWVFYNYQGYSFYEINNYKILQNKNVKQKVNIIFDGTFKDMGNQTHIETPPYFIRIGIEPRNDISSIDELVLCKNNIELQHIKIDKSFNVDKAIDATADKITLAPDVNTIEIKITTTSGIKTIPVSLIKYNEKRKESRLKEFFRN